MTVALFYTLSVFSLSLYLFLSLSLSLSLSLPLSLSLSLSLSPFLSFSHFISARIMLIPSPMCSRGSLLTPQKTLNSGLRCNTLISGWAWYVHFQPEARTISAEINSLSHKERSRDKIEGTKVTSVVALVGVGAGIKSLSHLPLRKGIEIKSRALNYVYSRFLDIWL
eukprot:sb/3472424/